MPWTLDQRPGPGETVLHLTLMGGGCYHDKEEVGRIDIEETSDEVRLTPHIRKPGPPEEVCPGIGTVHPATAHLDSPVGDRKIIDATTGDSVRPDAPDIALPPPAGRAPVKGRVATVVHGPDKEVTGLTLRDGAEVRLTHGAAITEPEDDGFVPVQPRDLQVGDYVEVWAEVTLYRKPPIHLADYVLVAAKASPANERSGAKRLDGLNITLVLQPDSVRTGQEVRSRITVQNTSDRAITDPGCWLGGHQFSVAKAPPAKDDWIHVVVDCGGRFRMPSGFSDTFDGPIFRTDGLAPGRYNAYVKFRGVTHVLAEPLTVTD